MEDWVAELQRGRPEVSWDLFLDRYRRVIFAAIRHYARDYDDVRALAAPGLSEPRASLPKGGRTRWPELTGTLPLLMHHDGIILLSWCVRRYS